MYSSDIQRSYQACSWPAHFMTKTGVSNRTGHATFYSDGAMKMKEWGGGILPPSVNNIANGLPAQNIRLIRLSDFLINEVSQRKLPQIQNGQGPQRVLMKMDIEGSEIDVLPDILFNGGLGAINGLMIEFHSRLEKIPERQKAHQQVMIRLQNSRSLSKKY